jgi:ATP-dependent DNA ligase
MPLPRWIEPQLCKLATKAPRGAQWIHEIKLDGYRIAARIEGGRVKLLTRSGLDWTAKYVAYADDFALVDPEDAPVAGRKPAQDPQGTGQARNAPQHLGALLLGYYTDDGKLIYAGRVGAGMPVKVLANLRRRLDPIARKTSPLSAPPSRETRFGSPLVLSRVHWVEPELVTEITYLTWTAEGLLRHTVYVGLREDKLAEQVRRETARG